MVSLTQTKSKSLYYETSLYNVTMNSSKIMFFVSPLLICLSVHGNYIFVISEKEACFSLGSVYIASVNHFYEKNLRSESYHTELLLITANEQFIQQIYLKPGSESRERLFFCDKFAW